MKNIEQELRSQIISGFYEEEYPIYTQGYPTMELQEIVTAEECNNMVDQIRQLHHAFSQLEEIFRVNMIRAFPDKTHAEIDAEIDRIKVYLNREIPIKSMT